MRLLWTTWRHHCTNLWIGTVVIQLDTLWIDISNLYPQQCLGTQHTVWLVQDCKYQYQAQMRSFLIIVFNMDRWKNFLDGCFIPIRIHEVFISIGIWHNSI